MGTATLYPTSVSVVEVSSNLADYTADDGTYGASTDAGATMLEGSFATPASAPGGDQKVEWDSRKSPGSGTNSPTYAIELWNSSALVATLGADLGDELAGSITWSWATYAGSFAADGSDVRLRVQQTGGSGGNPNKRAYIESDYIRWIAAWSDDFTETIGSASTSLAGRDVVVVAPVVVQIAAASVALSGRAVVATVSAIEIIAGTAFALSGRAVQSAVLALASPAVAVFALTGKPVVASGATNEIEVVAAASFALAPSDVLANIVEVIGPATIAHAALAANFRSDLVSSILSGSTVLAGGAVVTRVDLIESIARGAMSLTGAEATETLTVLESIAKAAVYYFGNAVTTIPAGEPVAGRNLSRLLSLPGNYTFLWKELVREEHVEQL